MAGLFVGIGVGGYDDPLHPALPLAVTDVTGFAELLGDDFDQRVASDPDETAARQRLKDLHDAARQGAGRLVLLWAGHGVNSRTGLRLLARDSGTGPAAGVGSTDIAAYCAASGASQVLLILDTCYSGAALSAAAVAAEVVQDLALDEPHVWVGVLTSCQAVETAQDGLLGRRLRRLLGHGPQSPVLRLRWSVHNASIRGDDLCDALVKEWEGDRQSPQFRSQGDAWWMFRNPLYDPGAPEQVVEHLLRAARGGTREDDRSWFTGRAVEVDEVVGWVRGGAPGVHVVTGSAGTGKSAIVGRVVSLSNPGERQWLLAGGPPLEHDDPGERSVQAHVHARGLDADGAARVIGGHLVRCGTLPAQDGGHNAAELVGQLQRAVQNGKPTPVIVVDGLDEARGQAFTIAEDLVVRLARHAVVVVSTRDLPGHDDGPGLVAALSRDAPVLNLDDPDAQQRTRQDLARYVRDRLSGVDPRMDPALVAEHVAASGASAGPADRPFLLARLVTDQLRAAAVDTAREGWREQVAGSIEQAFDGDLATVEPSPARPLPGGLPAAEAARELLIALTRGYGAGLPEQEWLVIANAGGADGFDQEDLGWVLDRLGRYIVQDGEAGVAVYRLAHQSLADHLRPPFAPDHRVLFDPDAQAIVTALADRYRALLDSGVVVDMPGYLWRYLWRHAADAGSAGLNALRAHADIHPVLVPDVASADFMVADRYREWGYRLEALEPAEEAATIYRELAATSPAFRPDLASALNNLGNHYSDVGRHTDALPPAEEAVIIYRELAATSPAFRPDLAGALNNLSIRYSQVGRRADALPPAEEAVATYRELAATNPGFRPDLASALNNLGIRYSQVGRRADALIPTEEAVTLRRELAATDPAFQPNLAMALNSLGIRYSQVGRRADALPPAEEAVATYRELAATNPGFRPDLAGALDNLGNHYSQVGRRADALPPGEEAVATYRELAATNPGFRPDLAMALNNLGNRYSQVGRRADALPPGEEATAIYRELAATNPGFRPDLAMALNSLGIRYSQVGRRADALPPAEEAVATYRELAAINPAFQPDLAGALDNLGNHYSQVGRHTDAFTSTEEAVTIYRELAATNPAFRPDLAGALNNLGNRYSQVGRRADAFTSTEQAVTIYRELAATNPGFRSDLAMALSSLGIRYSQVGRHTDALPPAEEAVTIYRELAAANPAFRPDLAMALNSLGIRYSQVGRHTDALPPAEEAVTIYRELAAINPAFRPDLAGAFNNLGICYGDVGRSTDALIPTEEAVTIYRELAATNPAFRPDLVTALNNLHARHRDVVGDAAAEAIWRDALASVSPADRPFLLLTRMARADPGTPEAAQWLRTALALAGDDRGLVRALHEEGRRHRTADRGQFDGAWGCDAGDRPGWLLVDAALLATAREWIGTPTFAAEGDYLADHPELLAETADEAVDEALLSVDDKRAGRYREIREAARAHGVVQAYRQLRMAELAGQFVDADAAGQAALLVERRGDLTTDTVRDVVAAIAERDDTGAADRADAVLALAQLGDAEARAALDALLEPETFPALLAEIAERPDCTALEATAFLARGAARTDTAAADAEFHLAVAAANLGDSDEASRALTEARRLDPGRAGAWIGRLAVIGRRHPAVLDLIGPLTEPFDPGAAS